MADFELSADTVLQTRNFGENATIVFKNEQSQLLLTADEWSQLVKAHRNINEQILIRRSAQSEPTNEPAVLATIGHIQAILEIFLSHGTHAVLTEQFNAMVTQMLDLKFSAFPLSLHKRLRIKFYGNSTQIVFFNYDRNALPIELLTINFPEWNLLLGNLQEINRAIRNPIEDQIEQQ